MSGPLTNLLISCAAIVVSIVALIVAARARSTANKIRAESLKLAQAQVEMGIRNQVSDAKYRIEDFLLNHGDFIARVKSAGSKAKRAEKERADRLALNANSRCENYLNALNEACQKYIDGKADGIRFKKAWQVEVRQTVKEPSYREFLQLGHTYHSLMRVHNEWENTERQ